METPQITYLAAFIAAVIIAAIRGRRDYGLWAILAFNFAGTVALSADPVFVAVLDLACAALLIGGNQLARFVAVMLATMAAIEWIGAKVEFPNAATYAIVDVLGYAWLVIIGGASGTGIRNGPRCAHSDRHSLDIVDRPQVVARRFDVVS